MQGAAFMTSPAITSLQMWSSLQQLDTNTSAPLNVPPGQKSKAALQFGARLSCCVHLVLLLGRSGGAEAFESCGGRRRAAVRRHSSGVHGADVVQRIVLFPLPEVAELSEAQLLWLEEEDIPTPIKTKAKDLRSEAGALPLLWRWW